MKKLNTLLIPFAVLGLLASCGTQNNDEEKTPKEESHEEQHQEEQHEEEHHEEEHHEDPPVPEVKAYIAKRINNYDSNDRLRRTYATNFDEEKRELYLEAISYNPSTHSPNSRMVEKILFDEDMNMVSSEHSEYDGLLGFSFKSLFIMEYDEKGNLLRETEFEGDDEFSPATERDELYEYTYDENGRMTSYKYSEYDAETSTYYVEEEESYLYEDKKMTYTRTVYDEGSIYDVNKEISFFNDQGLVEKKEVYDYVNYSTSFELDDVYYYEYSTGDNGCLIETEYEYEIYLEEERFCFAKVTQYISDSEKIEQSYYDKELTEPNKYVHTKTALRGYVEYFHEEYYGNDIENKLVMDYSFTMLNGLIPNKEYNPYSGKETYVKWANEFDDLGRLTKTTRTYSSDDEFYTSDTYITYSDYEGIYDEKFAEAVRWQAAYYLQ